ncbi:DUF3793 family protein [Natranaerobius trueperi]|uniref:DUF3793 domain-containing protein n=1 Tax=Natranaerobius trueperi TaxID=759412 RepID=A0A226BVH4_9FIRM|nr:DUF3793 family protein [Natranaerobius trueperi]OWZ83048.1 hypothetical protein CDO51_10825 [Natranaerobius trueperi]
MNKLDKLFFLEFIDKLHEKERLKFIIDYNAAPTIKNIKPATLISFTKRGKALLSLWKSYRHEIEKELQLESFDMRETKNSTLVLFYKEKLLDNYIKNSDFLLERGYFTSMSLNSKLNKLRYRFLIEPCPHEVGIFLGIPEHDVEGFINNNGKGYIMKGYWKVYKKPEYARKLFREYDKAKKEIICKLIQKIVKYEKKPGGRDFETKIG